jgi:hypothetical protein
MAWLTTKGAADRVRGAVQHFVQQSDVMAQLGAEGVEMRQHMVNALVAGGVLMELARELSEGKRMDTAGLRIASRFLRDYPTMLPNMQQQAARLTDPNARDIFNTLLARAQTVNTQPTRKR